MALVNAYDQVVRSQRFRQILLLVTAMGSALAIGVIAGRQPLAAGGVLAIPLLAGLLALPDLSTLLVFCILYSNAAVIAVRFHGLPYLVAAGVPALLIIPLGSHVVFRRGRLFSNSVLLLLLVFLAIQMIGALLAVNVTVAVDSLSTFIIEGIGLYFLIINVVRTPEVLRRIIWALLFVGAFLGALSLYQQITHTFSNNYWGFAQMSQGFFDTGAENIQGAVLQQRLAGPLGDQNRYAQILLVLVPLGLFRFWSERSKMLRGLALLLTVLILVGVALTFSRGAAVGFVLMLAIVALLRYIKPLQIGLLIAAAAGVFLLFPQYATRLSSIQELSGVWEPDSNSLASADSSTQSRVTEMMAAALVFVDHPIIGVGPGMFPYYYREYGQKVGLRVLAADRQAHDLYLGMAAETGILGLTTFLAILGVTLVDLARSRRRWLHTRPELAMTATGFMLALISYMTTGIFLHLAYLRYLTLILALAAAASQVGHAPDSQPESLGDRPSWV